MKLSDLKPQDIKVVSNPQPTNPALSGSLKLSQLSTEKIRPVSIPEDPTRGSTPLMLKPLGVLAVPGQVINKSVGHFITRGTKSKIAENQSSMGKVVQAFLEKAHNEKDPAKRAKYLEQAKQTNEEIKKSGSLASSLDQKIQEAERINIPIPVIGGDIPALSNDTSRGIQQVAGRSLGAVGSMAPMLGPAGAGAFIGAGDAMEQGKSKAEIATSAGVGAVGGKILGGAFNAVSKTGLGGRILASPAAQLASKMMSPFQAKLAASGTKGAIVDTVATKVGQGLDKLVSPSTYLKPVVNGLSKVGQKVGLVMTPEQKIIHARGKTQDYWQQTKDRYNTTAKFDKNSPEILAREGITPESAGDVLTTTNSQKALQVESSMNHKKLGEMLESTGSYGSITRLRQDATAKINANFKGVEREQALNYMQKQLDALERDYAGKIITNEAGERIIPLNDVNEIKSYLWSQGYSSKVGPKSDAISAETARLIGNAAKTEIEVAASQTGPETRQAIIDLNQRIGELNEARKFLVNLNGKKLPGGKMTRLFARVVGAIAGSSGGPVGSITGSIVADELATMLQNPQFSVGTRNAMITRANKVAPKALEQALNIIDKNLATRATTLQLPAGGTSTIIPPAPKGSGGPNYNPPMTPATSGQTAIDKSVPQTVKPEQLMLPAGQTMEPSIPSNAIRLPSRSEPVLGKQIKQTVTPENTIQKTGLSTKLPAGTEEISISKLPLDQRRIAINEMVKAGIPRAKATEQLTTEGLYKFLKNGGDAGSIQVTKLADGSFEITDGLNRIAIAEALGKSTIKAKITKSGFSKKTP